MSAGALYSWGTVAALAGIAFALGFAPVFVVRLVACLYPKNHDRRRELVAEMEHVKSLRKTPEMWRWLGEIVATAIWEAPQARLTARRLARRPALEPSRWVEDWASKAACRDLESDELFVRGAEQSKAARVCTGCPVRAECLAEALDNEIVWGVWGGMTERERGALLERRPAGSWRSLLEGAPTDGTSLSRPRRSRVWRWRRRGGR